MIAVEVVEWIGWYISLYCIIVPPSPTANATKHNGLFLLFLTTLLTAFLALLSFAPFFFSTLNSQKDYENIMFHSQAVRRSKHMMGSTILNTDPPDGKVVKHLA